MVGAAWRPALVAVNLLLLSAIAFFAVPYTIIIYPFVFAVFPRLWSVARARGYITAADFVRGRYGDRWLALAIAVTGILATMPYIALQLVGLEVVIAAMGVQLQGFLVYLPLMMPSPPASTPSILTVGSFKNG